GSARPAWPSVRSPDPRLRGAPGTPVTSDRTALEGSSRPFDSIFVPSNSSMEGWCRSHGLLILLLSQREFWGGIAVTQLLRCLGLVGILAGASLMLPPAASSAVQPIQPCAVVGPGHYSISETT